MKTLEILVREHRWIERMLACLEVLIADALRRGRLDPEASASLLSLFEYFDGIHQRKEESVLYMRLLSVASPSDTASIARFLGDHERERGLMKAMCSCLLGAVFGRPEHVREFAQKGQSYLELHRRHMAQENAVLLPLAARSLDPSSDRAICEGFRRLELEAGVDMDAVVVQIESTCHRLGVTFPEEPKENRA